MQIRTTIKDKTSTCSCLLDLQEFYFIFFFYLFLPFLLTADRFCGYLPLRNSKHVKQIHTDKGPELRNGLAKIIKKCRLFYPNKEDNPNKKYSTFIMWNVFITLSTKLYLVFIPITLYNRTMKKAEPNLFLNEISYLIGLNICTRFLAYTLISRN